jgi:hypothetical protein
MGRTGVFLTVLIMAGLFLAPSSGEALIEYSVSTSPDNDCSDFDCDFQSALDAAEIDGDDSMLNLKGGVYNVAGPDTPFSYRITSPSATDNAVIINGAGQGSTILDGGNESQVLSIGTGGDISVKDLTVQNGSTVDHFITQGTGLFASSSVKTGSTITVEDCTFTDNTGDDNGQGAGAYLFAKLGTVTVRNSTFTGNGFALDFSLNSGGGLWVTANVTLLEDNVFQQNSANWEGGGAWVNAQEAIGGIAVQATITGNEFKVNGIGDTKSSTTVEGGALWLGLTGAAGTGTISDNSFTSNQATAENGVTAQGAASLHVQSGMLTLTDNLFNGNNAGGPGGADSAGADVRLCAGTVEVTNNVFINNSGGAAAFFETLGGASCANNTMTFTNNTLWNNDPGLAVNAQGDQGDVVNIYNNIVWANSTDINVFDQFGGSATSAEVNLVSNICITCVVVSGGNLLDSGNFNAGPQFVLPSSGDMHIEPTSPAVDMGEDNAPGLPAVDFDGEPRIQNNRVDIGADEVGPGEPDITVSPTSLDFGQVTVGSSSD